MIHQEAKLCNLHQSLSPYRDDNILENDSNQTFQLFQSENSNCFCSPLKSSALNRDIKLYHNHRRIRYFALNNFQRPFFLIVSIILQGLTPVRIIAAK